ncbi:tRNA (adenosine(37)-N6)-threonylcarbamoyltransferase complex dimerization subunit type 1 TsaB [Fusibacter ferrireducens]|uniref:tRNA (Adenosine(37)-N6)-threonylcarbamoyltransferase complex dimerization subunit type 1 TsaB n=1 Tax=Fusibacter ferrireducens TaxID=2785058 RepID=A0ABR9ZX09_9FIRM|nr:tRNA (adenosine(37)-N6)-threonylcarbamoyltransferase complex dimerization subunit type 1 TsaB [Fusibacter ferrireducens]MBF4694486.1 tRNA (adenosine(37)-N6)-threonylcarbamoyltransferase complex dimerization subunit type 1 TsaB [Fusibacter ferrireducens]
MKTMIVDTASSAASVALFDHKTLIGEFLLNTPNTHSQKLMPLVESILEMLHLKIRDLDLIIACEGPGSFTGVRIGLSTVKAFAQPYNIPLITETSLTMLAAPFKYYNGIIVPIIDAKRGEVYFGEMEWQEGQFIKHREDVEALSELLERLMQSYPKKPILLVGDATEIYKEIIDSHMQNHPEMNVQLADENENIPKASHLGFLIGTDRAHLTYHDVKANYMRKSQAERDLNARRSNAF